MPEVDSQVAPLQALCCGPRSTEERTFIRGEGEGRGAEKSGGGRAWPARARKGEKQA